MLTTQSEGQIMETATNMDDLLEYTRKEVDDLLTAYKKYKDIAALIADEGIPTNAPKFTLQGQPGKMQNLDPKKNLRKQLEEIGASMKFQNPLIWLGYKRLAYRDEPTNALLTLSDLVKHCQVDGICHRRFDAINLYMRRNHGGIDMRSQAFMHPSTTLETVEQDPRFLNMCLDPAFTKMWSEHENCKAGKWRKYVLTMPDHDCEINCTC